MKIDFTPYFEKYKALSVKADEMDYRDLLAGDNSVLAGYV